jgi:hypothetical protein
MGRIDQPMELEDEVSVRWSPNARVVIGWPLAPLLVAVLLGILCGFALGLASGRWRRRSDTAARMASMRLPGASPDVETELQAATRIGGR